MIREICDAGKCPARATSTWEDMNENKLVFCEHHMIEHHVKLLEAGFSPFGKIEE